MFGKLTVRAIPYREPIVMGTLLCLIAAGSVIAGFITYFKRWTFLWKEWLTSVDHKKIGVMYIVVAGAMLLRGLADALMMRAHQALSASGHAGFLPPRHYNQVISAHGVIMILFMATPLILGLMNFVIPLQVGARDMAFPFLNSVGFWLFAFGALLLNVSLGVGEFSQAGWSGYPPLSERLYSPGVGVDYWIWSIQISSLGTVLASVNFLTTILCLRVPEMRLMQMPVFTWSSLCASALMLTSFPILTATTALLALDRGMGTHFFTNDLGGNAMMYVNLFWAWGHPEVYILALPIFGIFSEVVSTFSRKPIFGYASLVWATVSITVLSFCVWLHHFFTMGSGADVNAFFGIMTMVIAVPTGIKILNWMLTMYRGRITVNSSMLWTMSFIATFSIGGAAGMLLAVPGIDFVLHNSMFLVAHFHTVIIGGVVFGCFAGLTYWFPKIFGFFLDETWGKRAFCFWNVGFYAAFLPLYVLGFMGMTRRLSQQIDARFSPWLRLALAGSILIGVGVICQIVQVIVSIKRRRVDVDRTGDPWNGRTLEWSTSSPPPVHNFKVLPRTYGRRDAFWYIKRHRLDVYGRQEFRSFLVMRNTGLPICIGACSFVVGFAMVWGIGWLALLGGASAAVLWASTGFRRNAYRVVTSDDPPKALPVKPCRTV